MQRAPLLLVALSLMAGIAVQHWLSAVPTVAWWWLLAITAVAVGIVLIIKRRLDSWLPVTALLLCLFAIGGTLGRRHDPQYNQSHWSQHVAAEVERQEFVALRLTTTPVPRERSYMAKADVLCVGNQRTEGEVKIYFKKEPATERLRYGDRLLVHTYIGGGRRTIYTTSDHYIVSSRDSTSLRSRSEVLRLRLLRRMQNGPLSPHERAVAEAMTLGWRADVDKRTQVAFRDAGIAHLLAVSGLHVGLIAAMLSGLCFLIPKERKGRIVRGAVQMAGVWGFALITGMAPSTMRAALMFSLFIISNMLGRRTPKFNLLAATAIMTLAVRPMLLFDVGWQLSYSAVAGILLAMPVITLWRNCLWQAAAVSSSATLATLPVTLAAFHRIQPLFLIANVIIVPCASVILAFSLAYMALPCGLTAWLLHWVIFATECFTQHVAAIPFASVEVAAPQPWLVISLAATSLLLLLSARLAENKVSN